MRAVAEKPHDAVVKVDTYRNVHWHRAVLPAIARHLVSYVRAFCLAVPARLAVKVIQGHPYWCRLPTGIQTVCRRNKQLLMPTLFLKLTKIWQRGNGKFVDFNDPIRFEDAPTRNSVLPTNFDWKCQTYCIIPVFNFTAKWVQLKTPNFYRAMLRVARLWDCMSSVCLSVRDVEVCFSHRLEYFENNFTAK